jgi:hypothetical protein
MGESARGRGPEELRVGQDSFGYKQMNVRGHRGMAGHAAAPCPCIFATEVDD